MEIDGAPEPGEIRHTLLRLWRRKWWVAAPVVLLVAFSLLKSFRATELYSSQANVRQADPNSFVVFQTQVGRAPNPERETATQIELVRSAAVVDLVREALGPRFGRIAGIRASSIGATDILRIEVTSADPQLARDAANAFSSAYLQQIQATQVAALEQQANELSEFNDQNRERVVELGSSLTDLDAQIASLEAAERSFNPPADLRARLDTLRSDRQLAETQRASLVSSMQNLVERVDQLQVEANARRQIAGQVLKPAEIPDTPVSPRTLRDALLYAMIGGLLGVALATGREAFGGKLRDVESVRAAAPELAVLGTPIQLKLNKRPAPASSLVTLGDQGDHAAQEAYRALRTSIQLAVPNGATLLVTSPTEREGKTTTVANLAGSLALAGARVAIACLDLHRPNVHKLFDLPNDRGLTSVLLGHHSLDEALLPIDVGGGSLLLLASGPLPPNAAEVIGSDAVAAVLGRLRSKVDFLVIDTPPILAVTDPVVASRWCDEVILVVRAGQTGSRQLHHALDRLRQANIEPLGIVFNGAAASTASSYYYSGYRSADPADDHISDADWDRIVGPGETGSAAATVGGSSGSAAGERCAESSEVEHAQVDDRSGEAEPGRDVGERGLDADPVFGLHLRREAEAPIPVQPPEQPES